MGAGKVKVDVTHDTGASRALRFAGRSFLAFVLAPQPPLSEWLNDLDASMRRSAGFFAGRPVIIDLSQGTFTKPAVEGLLEDLKTRGIRTIAVEGVDPEWVGPEFAPLTNGTPTAHPLEGADEKDPPPSKAESEPKETQEPTSDSLPENGSLLIESPVRSGQCIVFPEGDVTVVGSVASGAEIVAGGSIHVYGTLRGRAIAGSLGVERARIFCAKFDAELVAINGLYKSADEMGAHLRGRPVQARLEKESMILTPFD